MRAVTYHAFRATPRLDELFRAVGLGGVGDEAAAGSAEGVVEPDAGRERQEPCGDAGAEVVQRAGAVAFERQKVFAGPEDALDALADARQVKVVGGFVLARRAQQP